MRRPVIAGNWKCNLTSREAVALVQQLKASLDRPTVDVVVCPPFTALAAVASQLTNTSIALGAQDLFWEPQGAFTGEVSAPMLADLGCRYCIIGHSERRQSFGETDDRVHKKLRAALQHGLTPIVCVGETLKEREANRTFEVVRRQVQGALHGLSAKEVGALILAYEPVWAIGTGRNATPAQAQEAQAFIRRLLKDGWGAPVAEAVRIQYGGSVNASNALELLQQPDVDGALVGGASLNAEAFTAIVKSAAEAKLVTR
ncbi:MAG: triose-phosphate isomerase [Candidatus Omnitrophica bacterium]|nr:triose-phosphate isomerase [Candidatus Omnitrophota bacterium]